jgi:predicted Rossmann-fold nucleotide-binding protein
MKYKIGIFGSSAGDMTSVMPKAEELGRVLAGLADCVIIVTGGCAGLPYVVAKEAASEGVEVWGFSAELDMEQLRLTAPDDDHTIYSKLEFVPQDYVFAANRRARMKYRNVISTATCDAGIIISGRWGSLNEFTNLIDLQKTVGVLTSTGGIADELPELSRKISKEGQGEIIFNSDPEKLIAAILAKLAQRESSANMARKVVPG